ncbi:uncharacterized protein LOC143854760 [Tasmannia lanceolata]|uniref:uncharacterized protein LOC143854760 n=1 Tax=Tasmannia lanceolata TaxID=3420 RepID=UPI0040638DDE
MGITTDQACLLCHSGLEPVNHLFFHCAFSKWIWNFLLWRFKHRSRIGKTLCDEETWVRNQFRGSNQYTIAMKVSFGAAVYCIWRERNSRLHGGSPTHKRDILHLIIDKIQSRIRFLHPHDNHSPRSLQVALHFNIPIHLKPNLTRTCSWIKPPVGVAKINTDASLFVNGASLGGLIRDLNSVLALFSIPASGDDITILELKAIDYGIFLAQKKALNRIWVESDSLNAVNIINSQAPCPWKALTLLDKICLGLAAFVDWKVTHVWREANLVADFLSKEDCPCKGDDIPPSSIPNPLKDIIATDSAGVPYTRT